MGGAEILLATPGSADRHITAQRGPVSLGTAGTLVSEVRWLIGTKEETWKTSHQGVTLESVRHFI